MSKSMQLMVDTSQASNLIRTTPAPPTERTTFALSSTTTTSTRSPPISTLKSITKITTTISNEPQSEFSNEIDSHESNAASAETDDDYALANNIKVFLARQQQQQRLRQFSSTTTSTPPSKLRSAIRSAQIEVCLAVFVSFVFFLVIYSIFSLRRNGAEEKLAAASAAGETICDKAKLLPAASRQHAIVAANNGTTSIHRCSETAFCQPSQTIHV